MAHDIILFILGLALVIVGGNYVTTGASAIARHFRLSPLLIGVTVVAFGSSMPDLVVCMSSTIKGHSELALGDVVGSNVIDILLAIGLVCIIRPVGIDSTSRFIAALRKETCIALGNLLGAASSTCSSSWASARSYRPSTSLQ